MSKHILWIEGKRIKTQDFVNRLRKKRFDITVLPTGQAALNWLEKNAAGAVVVNAASLGSNGKGICQRLRKHFPRVPVLLILSPEFPLPPGTTVAHETLLLPFTTRKLLNRINSLLPVENGDTITAGPIRLDTDHNTVECNGRRTHLTPRLASLLKVFLQNPGKVLKREELFAQVWETTYTGDTRTLDVHISWLRQAIEETPRKPRYLKTIRGLGYRLDV